MKKHQKLSTKIVILKIIKINYSSIVKLIPLTFTTKMVTNVIKIGKKRIIEILELRQIHQVLIILIIANKECAFLSY